MTTFPSYADLVGHNFDNVDGAGLTHRHWMGNLGDTLNLLGTAATNAATDFDPSGAAAAVTPTTLGLVIGTNVEAHDADLTAIAGLDSSTSGTIASDGSGWIKKTYTQFKTALGLVKADVGLGSVDNTADTAKPVSTAQQTALDLKANLASPMFTGTVVVPAQTVTRAMEVNQAANSFRGNNTGSAAAPIDMTVAQSKTLLALVKADVGLGNVDNTADASKAFAGSQITSGTVPVGQLPTGTDGTHVPLGGVITGAGPTGDASHTLTLTYNAAGQLTAVTNNAIAIAESQVTNLTTDLAAKATAVPLGRTKHSGTTDYSLPGVVLTATGTIGLAANTVIYSFIYTPTAITLDQMAFNIITSQAGAANVRVGIYGATTDWQPDGNAPIFDTGIAVANGFTGAKVTIAAVTLQPGRYLLAMNCDVAITGIRSFRGVIPVGAIDSALGTGGVSATTGIAQTYGAFPTPGTAWTTTGTTEHPVVIRISVP